MGVPGWLWYHTGGIVRLTPASRLGGSRHKPEVIPVGPGVDPGIMLVGAQGSPVVTPALHHGGSRDDSMVILGVF